MVRLIQRLLASDSEKKEKGNLSLWLDVTTSTPPDSECKTTQGSGTLSPFGFMFPDIKKALYSTGVLRARGGRVSIMAVEQGKLHTHGQLPAFCLVEIHSTYLVTSYGQIMQRHNVQRECKTNESTNDMVNLVYCWQMAIFTIVRQLIRHKSTKREIWKLYKGVKLCFCVEASEKLIVCTAGCLRHTARERFN